MDGMPYDSSVGSPASSTGHNTQRTKRMRTSFKHHQLRTMKSYFAINQNPDAKDLKQLAQKTGLSKRVLQVGPLLKPDAHFALTMNTFILQVWFQNARAKWRRNLMRQEGNQNGNSGPNGNSLGPVSALLDSNSLSSQSGMDDVHPHHIHSQNVQTMSFGDIY